MAKKDEIPKWVSDEIQNAEFGDPEWHERNGYVLEIYEQPNKIDVQLYEPIEDGRHIVTLDMPEGVAASDLERGVVYEFAFDQYKAPLSREVSDYLQNEKHLDMTAIYRFELRELERLDVDSADSGNGTE